MQNQNLFMWKWIIPPKRYHTFINPGSGFGGLFFPYINISHQTFVLMKTSWRCLSSSSSEDVFKTSSRRLDQGEYVRLSLTSSEDVFKTSSRRLGQDQYIRLSYTSSRCLQDVFKTSSKHLQDVLPRRLQDVFKTSSRCLAKTSSRHLQDVFKTFWRLQDIFKTSSRRINKLNCSC